jgi:colanic acid/amylovoran biosynthesis glycosyltransferase
MKIAFLIWDFPTISETFLLNQITTLIDMGHDIEIFSNAAKNKKIHPDVNKYGLFKCINYYNIPKNKVIRIIKAIYLIIMNLKNGYKKLFASLNIFKYKNEASSLKLLYVYAMFLKKKINNNFDIIHCHFGPQGIFGLYLIEIGIIKGKLVTSFHGFDVNRYPKQKGNDVYKLLFRKCNVFTANSNYTKQQLISLGCDEDKIFIMPECFKIEKFNFIKRKKKKKRYITILTIARLVEKKGHMYAIKAISRLVCKYENIQYLIAGDGPLFEELNELTEELKIKNYIKFLGTVDENEVIELYEKADIFILPSVTAKDGDKEGQGLVLQEAQAKGIPVISTYHNGIPEGVVDGKSGFLVPEKDVDALVEKVQYFIDNPSKISEFGKFGRKFVIDNFDIKKLNKRLISIYQKYQNQTNIS